MRAVDTLGYPSMACEPTSFHGFEPCNVPVSFVLLDDSGAGHTCRLPRLRHAHDQVHRHHRITA